jgi:hypothetical protein
MLLDPTERALESALEQHEQSSHGSLGSFKHRSEVRDAWKRALVPGLYCDDQHKGKEMSQQNG